MPPTEDSIGDSVSAVEFSRRRLLQSGLVLGAFAVAPTDLLQPLLPDPGQETRGAFPTRNQPRAAQRLDWPVPPIVSRAEWGADESLRAPDADFDFDATVSKLVIHHTVTPNNAASDAAVVRSIFNYHTSIGYFDIAYNFLIGRNGRLYEGRWARNYPDGVPHIGENATSKNVRAAHSSSTNTQTIGVALLGDYRTDFPTDAQIETLATFLAWKCARWGLEVPASVPYLDGRVFPTISAHRNVTATSCPGDTLYGQMEFIRTRTQLKSRPGTRGYWVADAAGRTDAFGDLPDLGDPRRTGTAFPIVGIAAHPNKVGHWCVSRDGGVFAFGMAQFFGSAGGLALNAPVIGMAVTPTGNGYWIVSRDGGIFTYGDARFFGSTGSIRLNAPVVGMAATPSGNGYWLVASDGGVFSFGDARFFGSTGSIRLNAPVVGM
ncbi:MAG: N-acetylmuramoyl-L-alanine amidase, partial [Acidimicrobiia bacterium]